MITVLATLGIVLYIVIAVFTGYVLLLSYSLSHIGEDINVSHVVFLVISAAIWPITIPLLLTKIL